MDNTAIQKTLHLGFIGGGNMSSALIGGLLRAARASGAALPRIDIVDPDEEGHHSLRARFGANTYAAPAENLAACDAIIIAVKPQQFRAAALALAPYAAGRLIVSVAAGIRTTDMARWLKAGAADAANPIVRCMPNTPALVGAGMTGLYATPAVTTEQKQLAQDLLDAVGSTLWVDEETLLDAITAISGSGPAYVFAFIEALQRGGVELGLSQAAARKLAVTTFVGAAKLAEQSEESISTLRERVTSKGGTTYAALTSMTADGVAEAIIRGVQAAAQRSAELGDEFGQG